MKPDSSAKVPNRPAPIPAVFFASLCLAAGFSFTRADEPSLRPAAYLNGIDQQALGSETAELARNLGALIDELQRNGFPPQSLAGLDELVAQLGALGGQEMSALAARLRKLGETTQGDPRAAVAEAYLGQQAIETRLKTLARQIALRQLRDETARRLEALIVRQGAAQRETRVIATTPSAGRQRLLESDQGGIGEDLLTFFRTGDALLARLQEGGVSVSSVTTSAGATVSPETAPTFSERVNSAALATLSGEALDGIKERHYPEAYARQESLLTELRKILQGMLSSQPKEERLASALQQVSALRQQQETARKDASATAEAAQAAADQARLLASQIAPVNPEAAAALEEAQNALQAGGPERSAAPGSSTPPQAGGSEKSSTQTNPERNAAKSPDQGPSSPAEARAGALAALTAAENALRRQLVATQGENTAAAAGASGRPATDKARPSSDAHDRPGGESSGEVAGKGGDADGPVQATGVLRREEREALGALQNERYPAEYSAWVQQYWRNLTKER